MAGHDAIKHLAGLFGSDVLEVAGELMKKDNYSEFKLAEAVKKEVNETRNLLYRLHSANLASFIKKKDRKIGWYIHYWTFHPDRVGEFVLKEKKARLDSLMETKSSEGFSEGFFVCPANCVGIGFDRAVDLSFRCPECGEILSQSSRNVKSEEREKEIETLKKDILEFQNKA